MWEKHFSRFQSVALFFFIQENYEDLSENAVVYINVGSEKKSQYQIESSSETTTALFNAIYKAKTIIGRFVEQTEDFTNR